MTGRLAAATATAAVCLLGGVTAPATAEPLMFSVTAERGASARFHLPTDTTVSFDEAQVTSPFMVTPDYAGMVVYTDEGRQIGGILTAPAMSIAGHELDPVYYGRPGGIVLRTGWYRVVVLTNAPVTIRVPIVSGTGVSVNATAPHAQAYKLLTKTVRASGRVTVDLRAPLPRSTATSKVAMLARLTPAVVDGKLTLLVCASQRGKPCAARDSTVQLVSDKSGPNVTRVVQAGLSTGGRPIAGTRDAFARLTLTPAASAPFTFLFVHWNEPKPAKPRRR